VPLAGHQLLKDRLIIDDPDGFEADAPAQHRMHGTSMASLIVHGELEAAEPPLPRRIYCRPIMKPQASAHDSKEHIPDGVLPVDLIHRAVRRLFEGEGPTEPQAPEVQIINLSVGDPSRLFFHGLSPWARLLDWLSYKYGVLFIVSAGNHATALDLDIPKGADWSIADAETREVAVLRALKLRIQVNCREDAAGLDEEIDYGLVVSFEVGEKVPVDVYEQVRQRLRTAVPITP
jgi:hypothetical protein